MNPDGRSRFQWIREAMAGICYPRFFHCEPLTAAQQEDVRAVPDLPPSYLEFLAVFGRARFFRELDRDSHEILVLPPLDHGEWVQVATCDPTMVLLHRGDLAAGAEAPLFAPAGG